MYQNQSLNEISTNLRLDSYRYLYSHSMEARQKLAKRFSDRSFHKLRDAYPVANPEEHRGTYLPLSRDFRKFQIFRKRQDTVPFPVRIITTRTPIDRTRSGSSGSRRKISASTRDSQEKWFKKSMNNISNGLKSLLRNGFLVDTRFDRYTLRAAVSFRVICCNGHYTRS